MKDLISVVVPVHKKKYLDRCIKSLVNQTYKNLQIILVNDGSTDGSLDVLNSWGGVDRRIVILSQENKGAAAARNNGIEYALKHNPDGYLAFLDDDDFMAEDGIETLYKLLKDNNVAISWGHFYVMFPDREELENDYQSTESCVLDAHDILMQQSRRSSYNTLWGKLFRIDIWKDTRLPEDIQVYEDVFVMFRLIYNAGKIAMTKKQVVYYFLSEQSLTRSKVEEKRCRDAIRVQEEALKFYQEKKEKKLYRIAVAKYLDDILDNMVYSTGFDNAQRDFFKEMKHLYRKNILGAMLAKIPVKLKLKYILYFCIPRLVVSRHESGIQR